jgi:hypothetical protein
MRLARSVLFLNTKNLLRKNSTFFVLIIKMAAKRDKNKEIDKAGESVGAKLKEIDSEFNFVDEKIGIFLFFPPLIALKIT